MAERFLSARPHGPNPQPPFPLVSSASFGSARSRPGREAAKRTLDGEDRSDTMKREGKGGLRLKALICSDSPRRCFATDDEPAVASQDTTHEV